MHLAAAFARACHGRSAARTERDRDHGQSLVEFSLVLMPFFLIILGVIQFGFVFNAYVTMTNAAREGARTGTIYIYNAALSKDQNDLARNSAILTAVTGSMNLLNKTAPQFSNGSSWTQSGTTYTNGDLTITYTVPAGITDSDSREGELVTVSATYHMDLVVPLISAVLPKDSGGRLGLGGVVTMTIN